MSLLIAAALAGVGLLIAVARDSPARDSVAMALWVAGAIVLVFVGLVGSPSTNLARKTELERRTTRAPLARTPFGYALVGLVLVTVGVLVYVFA